VGSTLVASVEGVEGGPVIAPGGVVNSASFGPRLGIGAYVTIFGTHLAGARLKINGAVVPTAFTSDTQVNFLSPATLSPGLADVAVETALGISVARVEFNTYAPGIFVPAEGFLLEPVKLFPAPLLFFTTGAGSVGDSLKVQVDGASVPLVFPPVPPPPPGIQHIYVYLPTLTRGTHALNLSVNGIVSNTVKLQISLLGD